MKTIIGYILKFYSLYYVIGLLIFAQLGCKKLVTVDAPVTSITGASAYSTDATAASVLTGMYTKMGNTGYTQELISVSLFLGLSADEFNIFSGVTNTTTLRYYRNALSTSPILTTDYWKVVYPMVYVANSVVDGLNASGSLTPAVKQQLLGEAKFMRAFCYFYLVNLYGDVPLAIHTDYTVNGALSRTPKAQVWQQIINDLLDAQNSLNAGYVGSDAMTGTTERTRPNKYAATALLARAYLYSGDWADAEKQSSAVINSTGTYSLVNGLKSVFLENSSEAIWQLQPVIAGQNTPDGIQFNLPASGPNSSKFTFLSPSLLSAFEPADQRRIVWVDSAVVGAKIYYYPFKYEVYKANSPVTEYTMMLRLAEQYLIRAEARAQQGNTDIATGALADLNLIRIRAGLTAYSGATDKSSVLKAILHERQVELFSEWGHRWFDLKRTDNLNSVMSTATPQKGGGSWDANQQWYPIPLVDMQRDPQLTQNTGY